MTIHETGDVEVFEVPEARANNAPDRAYLYCKHGAPQLTTEHNPDAVAYVRAVKTLMSDQRFCELQEQIKFERIYDTQFGRDMMSMSMGSYSALCELLNRMMPQESLADENATLRARIAELEKAQEWMPIEKMPKKIPKGFMRVYSFKESLMRQGSTAKGDMLPRAFKFERNMGFRECDLGMDIPEPIPPRKD